MRDNNLFNHDNELSVLALILKSPERLYDVMDSLKGFMFSSTIHEQLYTAMCELARDGNTSSPSILKSYLTSKKRIDQAGGPDYIDMIAKIQVDGNGFDVFLKGIIDSWKAKQLLELAAKLPIDVKNNPDISETISSVNSIMANLEDSGLRNGVHPFDEVLIGAWEAIEKRTLNPGIQGVTTGFVTLDDITGGYGEGQEWIFCGRPSHGKTSAILQSLKEAAKSGTPSLIFSREMRNQDLLERYISMESGVPYLDIRLGKLTDQQKKKCLKATRRLAKLPVYFDSNFYGDMNYISGVTRKFKKMHGIKLIGVDYIQLLAERGNDQTAELGKISRQLKLLAADLGITVVVAAQLNRKVEEREEKRPILSDIRQSGNIEEDADVVVAMYRDEVYNLNPSTAGKIDFIILKQRNGPLGTYTLDFDEKCVAISDAGIKKFEFGVTDDGD
jgi:replicative DNA helicase